MPSQLEWYTLAVVLTFVGLIGVGMYYDAKSRGYLERRVGTPVEWLAIAAFVGIALVGVFGIYGTVAAAFDSRAALWAMTFNGLPVVVGCLALAIAAGNGRTLLRLLHADDASTGSVTADSTGEAVAVTGLVRVDDPGTSPVFGREGACWSWRLYTRGRTDVDTDRWVGEKAGDGGVEFALDDGSGPVRVDPTDARVELFGGREAVYDADAAQPGRVGRTLRSSLGGTARKYEEAVATDGRELTVLGTAMADGRVDADRILDPGIGGVRSRYAGRAGALAVGGLLALYLGLRWTAGYFGVPLPG